jgi:hypothetical protein
LKEKILNEGNKINNFISSSGSGTVINYGSSSNFLTSYGSGSGSTTLPEMGENAALVVEQRRRIVSCELQLLPVLLADDGSLLGRQPVRKKTMGEVLEMRENAALVVEQRRRTVSCELQLLPVLLADNGGFLGRQPVRKKMDEVRLGN